MAFPSSAFEYRKSAVTGASPIQVIVLLYDGALKHMEAGRHAIAHQDFARQNEHLQAAQKIVMELMACLDMEKGGEIAWNLLKLYEYSLNELVRANIEDDSSGVAHAIRIFSDLRESWVKLADPVYEADHAIAA
jgi:flagellar protein FliS